MEWHHITIKQPEDGEEIVISSPPYEIKGKMYYDLRIYIFYLYIYRDIVEQNAKMLEHGGKSDVPLPNFWWIRAKDFPFPNGLSNREDGKMMIDCEKLVTSLVDRINAVEKKMLKRYLLFAGPEFYPQGGMDDFVKKSDSLQELVDYADYVKWDWAHIYDVVLEKKIRSCQLDFKTNICKWTIIDDKP